MNKKIKVAFFSGPTDSSVCLANALCQYCQIHFFYRIRYTRKRDQSILNLLNQEVKKIPINNYRIRDIRNIWSYCKISKKLKNYNVIHLQDNIIWFSLCRIFFKNIPVVCTVHDPYQHIGLKIGRRYYENIAQKCSVSQSSKLIVFGEKQRRDLVRKYNLSFHNVEFIPHGEYSFYKNFKPKVTFFQNETKEFKRILFFGTIRNNKGLEYLIKAEPIISRKYHNYKICIAGKFQGNFNYYRKFIRNIDNFEIFDNYIPNNQVADLLEKSDIVVLPYISATQSGVLHLAFAFGKPVVSSDVGSISEVLEDGKTGFLVEPRNERALADAIIKLLSDDKLSKKMGKNALRYCEKNLSWDSIAKKTIEIYSELIKK